MKRRILFALAALLLFSGCGAGSQPAAPADPANSGQQISQNAANEPEHQEDAMEKTVTFINGVTDADVWILPHTEKNLKTTVWGTATAAGVKTGERRETPLCEPGDDGLYLLRMIDVDHYYYSANGIALQPGWTLKIEGGDLHSVTLEVADENGALKDTYSVFAARL